GEDAPRTPPPSLAPAYGLTHNVDREFWETWRKQNEDHELVKHNLIFASPKPSYVKDQPKEHTKTKCGVEPLLPPTPPAVPGGKIHYDDDRIRLLARHRNLINTGTATETSG